MSGREPHLRRLYAKILKRCVGGDGSRSAVPKGLADFIGLRDQCCRTPYCDAPVRHRDHADPHPAAAPPTANGLGLCERCNYVKEVAGWHVTAEAGAGGRHRGFITPTGAHHHSTAPPMQERPDHSPPK